MTLHILNKPSSYNIVNQQLSNAVQHEDCVVLIENAVYQCLNDDNDSPRWQTLVSHIYVLEEDALARGIKIPESFSKIDYNAFVKLTTGHQKVVSWY